MNWRRWVFGSALLMTLMVVVVTVWPTRYRAIDIRPSPRVLAARENRFTGRIEFLTRSGWVGVNAATVADTTWDPLSGYTPNWRVKP